MNSFLLNRKRNHLLELVYQMVLQMEFAVKLLANEVQLQKMETHQELKEIYIVQISL